LADVYRERTSQSTNVRSENVHRERSANIGAMFLRRSKNVRFLAGGYFCYKSLPERHFLGSSAQTVPYSEKVLETNIDHLGLSVRYHMAVSL